MILMKVDNVNYYDEVRVLIKAFHPFAVVELEQVEDIEKSVYVSVINGHVEVQITEEGKPDILRSMDAPDEDKKSVRDTLNTTLYKAFGESTGGKTLPWGTLTGIRPTKIVMGMLDKGISEEEIRSFMRKNYLISQSKLDLSMEVAAREKKLLSSINYNNGYSIYIGIPFCPTTCLYCSFTSYPIGLYKEKVDAYLDALIKEMDFVAERYKDRVLDTVYFGGGTPTTLLPKQLDRLLTALYEKFDMSNVKELTVEAGRPDSVTEDKFRVLKAHNVSRISINPQTMKQATLDLIGRRHTVEQVVEAFNLARKCGFDNINMDLIVGLPQETIEDVRETMERISELKPDNLTVHSLAIKRAAALNFWKEKYMDSIVNTNEIIELTARYARQMGLNPYYLYRQKNMAGNFENVGYARNSMEGIYNILIMEEKQTIIAMGAGASSKFVFSNENRIERIENVKDVKNYIERIDEMIQRKRSFFEKNNL